MNKTNKLIIIGLGETAELAFEYFTYDSKYEIVAFCVSAEFKNKDTFFNLPVVILEDLDKSFNPNEYECFVAMAGAHLNRDRTKIYKQVKEKGYKCASYLSSKCFKWHNVKIGENCFILEDNTLQPFTQVGNNVVMWSGNHLGHRSIIKDNCFITSHIVISGFCEIGENCYIGVNAAIADNVSIEKDCFITMGAVVNKNVKENSICTGNPATISKVSARKFCGVKNEVE